MGGGWWVGCEFGLGVSFHGNIIKGFEEPAFLVEMGKGLWETFSNLSAFEHSFFCTCSLPHPCCSSGFSNSISFFSHDEESVIYVAIMISMII